MSEPIVFRDPVEIAPPLGAYSHVAVVPAGTELLFLAGQVGMTPDGALCAGAEEQFIQALRNVVAILAAEGCGPGDIVRLTTYLVEPLAIERVRAARIQILGDARPPASLLYVPRLATDDILVEVEATAARRRSPR
jgi:enamine deaminase RidA (YjgF/YER057c/UK114 family)